jgi:hypothetical protein
MPGSRRRRRAGKRARAAVAWGAFLFLAGQGTWLAVMDLWWPTARDPEYGARLTHLRARLAERPGRRPLVLLMGSSLTACGIRPEQLAVNHSPSPACPVVYNFGILRCTPEQQVLFLRRLLKDGVRPDAVVAELHPIYLSQPAAMDNLIDVRRLNYSDLRIAQRYSLAPALLRKRWLKARLIPSSTSRVELLSYLAPGLIPPSQRPDSWDGLNPWGFLARCSFRQQPPKPAFRKAVEDWLDRTAPLLEHLPIIELPDRAVRELVWLCKSQGIVLAFLVPPELGALRARYSPASHAIIARYCETWHREQGIPVIDARAWIADEHFADVIHLTHEGATTYTRIFEDRGLPAVLAQLELPAGPRASRPLLQVRQPPP